MQKNKLLVIDDDPIITRHMQRLFVSSEYEVEVLHSGGELFNKLSSYRPDLIILDVNLPDISGFDCLSQLKQDPTYKEIPVLMLTGVNEDRSVLQGIGQGAVDYMTKPYQEEQLKQKVQAFITRRDNTVLIVDDDPIVVSLLQRRLSKMGYQVETVDHGKAVLEKVESMSPKLILLDIMLPDVDGVSVLCALKKGQHRDIPVFMLSSKNQTESIVRCFNEGAHDYIVKPFNLEELASRIGALFHRQKI